MRLLALFVCVCALALPAFAQTTQPAPSDQSADKALADSTRHGEWVDIALPGSEVKLKTWIVYPERKDKAPVVLVIHEIFGMSNWIRATTDALAAEGFIAVAPDFLSGLGPDGGASDSLGDKVREMIRKVTLEDQVKRLDAARDYAIKLSSATDKVGVIGFCWGGTASFNYACNQQGLGAAVVYYGTAPADVGKLRKISCAVLGNYGGNDNRVTGTVEKTTQQMKEAGKSFEPHVYDGAGHGFLRQQSGQNGANQKAAAEAWNRTIGFLRQQLEQK